MKRRLSDKEQRDKKIVQSFFPNLNNPVIINGENGKVIHQVMCRCGIQRKIKPKSGLTNLWGHIKEQHPNYEAEYQRVLDLDQADLRAPEV